MKKIFITSNIIIIVLLLTNFSYGQDAIDKTLIDRANT